MLLFCISESGIVVNADIVSHIRIPYFKILSMQNRMNKLILAFTILIWSQTLLAQEIANTLSLDDLSAFRPQAGNWQIVGSVAMDPRLDIHAPKPVAVVETGKKKKKTVDAPVQELPHAVTFQPGKGILLNINDDIKKSHLVTTWEHGDIDLELEVMLPKGSNSGIYLQGRYEVQLLDSWGEKNPKYSDIGGIYRNWETEPGKIYMGKAPLSNPAKAPGLWQKIKISFRAPTFDASGKKITNARFVSVELNGVKIHDNVEVPLPTGGPLENNEVPKGPIMIQGDHGPVAFRNIRYKSIRDVKASLSDITYKTYKGSFKEVADFTSLKPVKTGTSKELTCEVLEDENGYGVVYSGAITVPEDNVYTFLIAYTGGIKLVINGETLADVQRPDAWDFKESKPVSLKAGTYPVEIYNFKDASWMPPRLGFGIQTASSKPQLLHAFNSYPPDNDPTSPILIDAGSQPRLLRAFVDFNGDRSKRLTHTIGVGDPTGINYVYDLDAGNIACVWRGAFVDATPMWHDRGDGSFRPRGATQYLFVNTPLAFLNNQNEEFPRVGKEGEFRAKGYSIEEASGRPVFKYLYQGLEVEDKIYPVDNNRSITHEMNIKNRGTKTGLYYKIAEGSTISTMSSGYYRIDDQYYVSVAGNPIIREINGRKELVVSVEGSTVNYTIIW